MKTSMEKMEDDSIIYKEVIVVGNGPSGIITSLMLSGRLPYFVSREHPDEMLSARLKTLRSPCLITQDLAFLAQGLEGRSTNPVSLLMDALLHPCADLGLDLQPLVEFKPAGKEIDHLVLGRGPPGGSWHRIDPDVLTLSLGSWMSLPEKPFPSRSANENRAFSRDVASYYENYAKEMQLTKYFENDAVVTSVIRLGGNESELITLGDEEVLKKRNMWVKKLDRDVSERVKDYFVPLNEDQENRCFVTTALNCLLARYPRRTRACKRRSHQAKSESIIIPKHERKKPCSCCGDTDFNNKSPKPHLFHSHSLDTFSKPTVPFYCKLNSTPSLHSNSSESPNWLIESINSETNTITKYTCKYLVLACGSYDSPNRLDIFGKGEDPEWLIHDLRKLENRLDEKLAEEDGEMDPVLVVGAGLSAADAVMAVRSRNVPVVHVFRGRSAEFTKQLPENMYPEYHKVRQMMNDGGSTYPLYAAYPEHSLTDFDPESQVVVLTAKSGDLVKVQISFAAVLIGSRPNLSFMPPDAKLGVFPDKDIDSKSNPVDINPLTHEVNGHEGLFAVGPLAGDNFVRYIPGGAVAVVAELYRKKGLVEG
ncbi:oxidative stress-induced growth inhibitor 1-like isoform X1 [Euwallacea fornicatus]|uniref:oxidative stress-induced growth inhibitor 1-like isoform X1 n=2 Tax=Euwallacea fornicatus TaxID=995702 RepID=UPI00338D9D45